MLAVGAPFSGGPVTPPPMGDGAVYVYKKNSPSSSWDQTQYMKASNAGAADRFGASIATEEKTIAVGAAEEASNAVGSNGDQSDNSQPGSGAVYLFDLQ